MAPPYLNTPRTDVNETILSPDKRIGFDSEIASFIAPPNADQIHPSNGQAFASRTLMTPVARAPLARRRHLNAKPEFTPLLKSAAKNRMFRDNDSKENPDVSTPGGSRLRMSVGASSPAFPDHSVMVDSSVTGMDHTPVIHESSSSMSTPIPMMPRKGELGLGNADGNILSLKEQEAKLEKIDKENFGLKLKIHFLEENLKRTGPEFNQLTIRENTELKANKVMLERDLKKYLKQLKQSEYDLEQYRTQLVEYMEKVKRRHMDEALRDDLERAKKLAEARAQEIELLKQRIESAAGTVDGDAMSALRDQIEDLEAELKDRQQTIDEREDEIEDLKGKLKDQVGDDKDDLVESQASEIEQLQHELRKLREEKNAGNEEELEALQQEHEEHIRELQDRAEAAERAKKDQLNEFSIRLAQRTEQYETQIESFQSRFRALEQSKNAEIDSLNMRLQLANSQGNNTSKLAQQATTDAHEKLKDLEEEKNLEIERLEARLEELLSSKDELEMARQETEDSQRNARQEAEDSQRKARQMEAELFKESQAAAQLRHDVVEKEKEIQKLRASAKSQEDATDRIDRLELALNDKVMKISELERGADTRARIEEEVKELQSKLQAAIEDVEEKQLELEDQQRQIQSLQHTVEDRDAELGVLRFSPDEPDSQIEGLHSIVKHRDEDLAELRSKVLGLEKDLGNLQKVADDRMKTLEDLRQEFAETKQDLEDEIEILEHGLEEAERRAKTLADEAQGSRSLEQERSQLQTQINELRRFQDVADADRDALQATVAKLRKELQSARDAASTVGDMSVLPKGSSAELRSLRVEQRDLRLRLEEAETALKVSGSRHRQALHRAMTQKDERIRELEADTQRHILAGSRAGKLSTQVVDMEKKHIAEMKGLVKQIQVLRARLGREKMFRGELAFQKRWFLMMVDMYDACNASNIRMIEEMGISPDPKMKRKPTLKVAAQAVIFCLRIKKASEGWAEHRRTQDVLLQKMEATRARGNGIKRLEIRG